MRQNSVQLTNQQSIPNHHGKHPQNSILKGYTDQAHNLGGQSQGLPNAYLQGMQKGHKLGGVSMDARASRNKLKGKSVDNQTHFLDLHSMEGAHQSNQQPNQILGMNAQIHRKQNSSSVNSHAVMAGK